MRVMINLEYNFAWVNQMVKCLPWRIKRMKRMKKEDVVTDNLGQASGFARPKI